MRAAVRTTTDDRSLIRGARDAVAVGVDRERTDRPDGRTANLPSVIRERAAACMLAGEIAMTMSIGML
jgi:hypothetical protein